MRHKLFSVALLALAFLLVPAAAFAQSDRGAISGTVLDPQGAVVPNAKVTATSLDTGEVREVTSGDSGGYMLPDLRAGRWRVSVEAPSIKTPIEDYNVAVQVTHGLDINLEIGAVADVVTVTSEQAAALQTDTPVRQTNVNERQVKELPLQVSAEFSGRTPLSFDPILTDQQRLTFSFSYRDNQRIAGGAPRFPDPVIAIVRRGEEFLFVLNGPTARPSRRRSD